MCSRRALECKDAPAAGSVYRSRPISSARFFEALFRLEPLRQLRDITAQARAAVSARTRIGRQRRRACRAPRDANAAADHVSTDRADRERERHHAARQDERDADTEHGAGDEANATAIRLPAKCILRGAVIIVIERRIWEAFDRRTTALLRTRIDPE